MKKKIIVLFVCMLLIATVSPVSGIINDLLSYSHNVSTINDGILSGYVNDTSMNPIEGALVRVYFHETYEEDYTDSIGYYHITNIPICYCLKNCTASKSGYTTEWILLSIVENTTYDFVLTHLNEYNGSLSGYVNDTFMNPIEGARVRVYFHETYEENYTDSSGCYNVNNIPICYCLKNCTASKSGYTTEWILLSIVENTTYDFVLAPNQRPNAPDIDGPTSGRVGVEYEWTIVAIDPDGDDITYYIDWGDECGGAEWHGPYPSGEEVVLAHMYTFRSTFIINAMTIDEHGAVSNWTYFEVALPKNKASNFNLNLLSWLFERFPNAFPILRHMLGL